MKFCTRCGTKIAQGSKFCTGCGVRLSKQNAKSSSARPTKSTSASKRPKQRPSLAKSNPQSIFSLIMRRLPIVGITFLAAAGGHIAAADAFQYSPLQRWLVSDYSIASGVVIWSIIPAFFWSTVFGVLRNGPIKTAKHLACSPFILFRSVLGRSAKDRGAVLIGIGAALLLSQLFKLNFEACAVLSLSGLFLALSLPGRRLASIVRRLIAPVAQLILRTKKQPPSASNRYAQLVVAGLTPGFAASAIVYGALSWVFGLASIAFGIFFLFGFRRNSRRTSTMSSLLFCCIGGTFLFPEISLAQYYASGTCVPWFDDEFAGIFWALLAGLFASLGTLSPEADGSELDESEEEEPPADLSIQVYLEKEGFGSHYLTRTVPGDTQVLDIEILTPATVAEQAISTRDLPRDGQFYDWIGKTIPLQNIQFGFYIDGEEIVSPKGNDSNNGKFRVEIPPRFLKLSEETVPGTNSHNLKFLFRIDELTGKNLENFDSLKIKLRNALGGEAAYSDAIERVEEYPEAFIKLVAEVPSSKISKAITGLNLFRYTTSSVMRLRREYKSDWAMLVMDFEDFCGGFADLFIGFTWVTSKCLFIMEKIVEFCAKLPLLVPVSRLLLAAWRKAMELILRVINVFPGEIYEMASEARTVTRIEMLKYQEKALRELIEFRRPVLENIPIAAAEMAKAFGEAIVFILTSAIAAATGTITVLGASAAKLLGDLPISEGLKNTAIELFKSTLGAPMGKIAEWTDWMFNHKEHLAASVSENGSSLSNHPKKKEFLEQLRDHWTRVDNFDEVAPQILLAASDKSRSLSFPDGDWKQITRKFSDAFKEMNRERQEDAEWWRNYEIFIAVCKAVATVWQGVYLGWAFALEKGCKVAKGIAILIRRKMGRKLRGRYAALVDEALGFPDWIDLGDIPGIVFAAVDVITIRFGMAIKHGYAAWCNRIAMESLIEVLYEDRS